MYAVRVLNNSQVTKVQQIVNAFTHDIDTGKWKNKDKLPTINEFSDYNQVSRDTVEKAYRQLKKMGYVASFPSRGYFVLGKSNKQQKVLLIFNKLSSFKKIIYENLLEGLAGKAKVDLQIHHYSPKLLKEILEVNLHKYDKYVIMPHFDSRVAENEFLEVIKMVRPHELVLLDKNLPQLNFSCRSVYQDFREDIYNALCASVNSLKKYNAIILVFPEDVHHPKEIIEGISAFSKNENLQYSIIDNVGSEVLIEQSVYIVTDEDNLAKLLMKIKKSNLILGKNIGIISFNETLFKELLDISVITTDFAQMGMTAASLVLGKECIQIKNPFKVIHRSSL